MLSFKRDEDADWYDTSFHGVEIHASLEDVTKLFGEPTLEEDYKTKHQWICKSSNGDVITIYDYKFDGSKINRWHIGGKNKLICLKFEQWFKNKIIKLNKNEGLSRR